MSQLVRLEGKHTTQTAHCEVEKMKLSDRQNIKSTTSDPRQLWSKVKILVLGFALFCNLWF